MNYKAGLIIGILAVISIFLPFQDNILVSSIRTLLSCIFVLFMPGYFLVKSLFRKDEIDVVEELALSFVLSISIVPILLFLLNVLGIPVNIITIYGISGCIFLFCFIYNLVKNEK